MKFEKHLTVELENCSFAKTVLMIIIVLYHSILFGNGHWFNSVTPVVYPATSLKYIAGWLNTFHIYSFIMISGFIFYYIKYEKYGYKSTLNFIKNKIRRLIVPYIFIAVLWVIPVAIYFFHYDVIEINKKYILGTSPNQLWFLLMLFDVFVIAFFMCDFWMRSNKTSTFVMLGLYAVGIIRYKIFSDVFQIFTAFRCCVFFYLGFKIRQYDFLRRINGIKSMFGLILSIILFVLCKLLELYNFSHIMISCIDLVIKIVGSVSAFALLTFISTKCNYKNNKVFLVLCRNSMGIYLIHSQIMCFCAYGLNGVINPYCNALVNFVVALLLSTAISSVLLRFKITRFLIGEK